MKRVIITANDGKKYTLAFNRKTAALFNDMGCKASDLREKPLVAVPVFIWCAFKAYQPSVKQKKTEEVWDELSEKSKNDVLAALIEMYSDTYTSLMGDEDGEDDEGNSAAVEFEE